MSARVTTPAERFRPALLDGLDEPVQRYFRHALPCRLVCGCSWQVASRSLGG